MSTIQVFNHVTVDGFFAGPHGEIDWFKLIKKDREWDAYTRGRSQAGQNALVFGRTTYEMMKSWWPTSEALKSDPDMAAVMNNSPKMVFSKTLKGVKEGPNWKNVQLFSGIAPKNIRKLKGKQGMTILGSGSIVQQFANLDLIDEYTLVVVPVILGSGKPLFKDVNMKNLELLEARSFRNGIAVLRYRAVKV